jgi:competence protein ComEA
VFKNMIKYCVSISLVWSTTSIAATQMDLGSVGDIKAPQQASEYIYRSSPKESLISVQLLGSVQKPGIYYVPTNTDLLKLLTLAGGSSNGGNFSDVMVRKTEPADWSKVKSSALDEHKGTYEVDVQELIKQGGGNSLTMAHNDLVYVPPHESFLSPETSKTMTIVSVGLSIVLTGLLIGRYSHDRE